MPGGEWTFAEKPVIDTLKGLGYDYIQPEEHPNLRDGDNHVLFRPYLIEALQRLNGIGDYDAEAIYQDLLNESENAVWLSKLRGDLSRVPQGSNEHIPIKLIDFENPANNSFQVTNQLYVKAQNPRIPDVVVYMNGIPLVVIECKSPLNWQNKSGEAFEQIRQYERDIPRLFFANQFNIITDGASLLYGATHSPAKFYSRWKDPWPYSKQDFANELAMNLWALLSPQRLLDLMAHFIVFETDNDTGQTVKKMCRYQQYRAVNKIIQRVEDPDRRRGLIWHTQGSGKSLTMVYAALKLKTQRTGKLAGVGNPNLMVLTDRVDLDTQISSTFEACGVRNPVHISNIKELHQNIRSGSDGLTVLSTIQKFQGSQNPIPKSENWIVMVDECHRTQEKDLGAYLQATLPDAQFFGFTGTPVKKDDKNTYANFSVEGEDYLDKYGIDDAVADGATVPIFYTGRKTDWQVEGDKLDILFDQQFATLPDEKTDELKKKGANLGALLKHPERVELIAYDIWTHFKEYAEPDGLKAQIVVYDREAVILYKRALDQVIAEDLQRDGYGEDAAWREAEAMSECVISINQEDGKPSEDPEVQKFRDDVKRLADTKRDKDKVQNFLKETSNPRFLIVCDKLLTGFDAPVEAVMYLDKPLKDHTLLQAIARTNRVAGPHKRNGLIVDYIGISNKLEDALSAYREDDVKNAMRPIDDLASQLRAAHAEVMRELQGVKRNGKDIKAEINAFLDSLQGIDQWYRFRRKARAFIAAYEALSPDPRVLDYQYDLKWINQCLRYGTQAMEQKESLDHAEYSQKIRDMLDEHVHATGLSTTIKLRNITDPDFWEDFSADEQDEDGLKTAAIRKSTELRKVTSERSKKNPEQYEKFSKRLKDILNRLETAQINHAEALKEMEQLSQDIRTEDRAHEQTGMDEHAYGIFKILEAYLGDRKPTEEEQELAQTLNNVYANDDTAPTRWQEREQLRKNLRQQVRQTLFQHNFSDIKFITERIEEYALKHHAKK